MMFVPHLYFTNPGLMAESLPRDKGSLHATLSQFMTNYPDLRKVAMISLQVDHRTGFDTDESKTGEPRLILAATLASTCSLVESLSHGDLEMLGNVTGGNVRTWFACASAVDIQAVVLGTRGVISGKFESAVLDADQTEWMELPLNCKSKCIPRTYGLSECSRLPLKSPSVGPFQVEGQVAHHNYGMGVVNIDQLKSLLHQYLTPHQAHLMNVCRIDRLNSHESNLPDPDVIKLVRRPVVVREEFKSIFISAVNVMDNYIAILTDTGEPLRQVLANINSIRATCICLAIRMYGVNMDVDLTDLCYRSACWAKRAFVLPDARLTGMPGSRTNEKFRKAHTIPSGTGVQTREYSQLFQHTAKVVTMQFGCLLSFTVPSITKENFRGCTPCGS
ncbi:hypothetical protein GOODEAATRI_022818 [Goodea atripinnis]|uniref:Uncharacterized protein n=1 Tax=Goodea atripinnis TaxID=208336 RepID=A0ABV0Q125_9TELE